MEFTRLYSRSVSNTIGLVLLGFGLSPILVSCQSVVVEEYEATALTTLTWQVEYTRDPTEGKLGRFEEFASASVLNRNGKRPEGALLTPDERGLWWAKVPPKPSLAEIEARKKRPYEQPGKPELLRKVEYQITYVKNGQKITLPTNYEVYRQVAKAYDQKIPLKLTFGLNNKAVIKAEPVNLND